jgi:RNA polymerase sigma factor (sigma-70 family)
MDDEDSPIAFLIAAAADGNPEAWHQLVDRYSCLLVSVIRRYRLTPAETEDVAQTVWLRLVEHLGALREPRALPMWLVTTGRRESLRFLNAERRSQPYDPLEPSWTAAAAARAEAVEPDEDLLRAERHEALLAGLAELPTRPRELLLLMMQDPAPSYAEISRRTGIPIGSIGPTRIRALDRLRRTPPIRAHLPRSAELAVSGGERHDEANLG